MALVLLAAESDMPWQLSALGLLSFPVLVLLNGFFVAAEFAMVAVRRTRIEELVAQGVAGASHVAAVTRRLDRTIAATQLGITLASIGLGVFSEPALAHLLEPLFNGLPGVWSEAAKHSVASVLAFCLLTFLHVVFGELIPKSLALQAPDHTALWVARPFQVFISLTRPFVVLIYGTANFFLRLIGREPASGKQMVHSVEELTLLIEDTEEAGILDAEQADIVQNVFRLSNKTVRDCMVPREKMAALELTCPEDKMLEEVRRDAHTRLPVYEGQIDNIVGVVNTKELYYLFSLRGVAVLEDALYPALFLKPDESVANALRLFRRAHRPMALVRDDEGKILGLVTLEDVLEEIVGDIQDEHDLPVRRVVRRKK
ncbi:MAG TPA: hemolysin family protein [Gemmataceae bacterium]|nr:hemolysin family protein [Gemmataceae bacterium]